jgi:hypothetical protein
MPPKSFAGPIVSTKDKQRPVKKKKRDSSEARGLTTMTRFIKEFYGQDSTTSESPAPASAPPSSTPAA